MDIETYNNGCTLAFERKVVDDPVKFLSMEFEKIAKAFTRIFAESGSEFAYGFCLNVSKKIVTGSVKILMKE